MKKNIIQTECPVRDILDRLGDKWSVLIIVTLNERTLRFSELKREISDISQRMLTLTLKNLERDGLLTRTVYATVPPRVDYALTDLGKIFHSEISGLVSWAKKYRPEIEKSREVYDKKKAEFLQPQI
ncbi:MAG: transcriptional regulator [Melioribacteraceae bacterium]|nr:MAG: transcriptional regulator [Melioribacteraceae bacterium]